jgi:hypothetical protein
MRIHRKKISSRMINAVIANTGDKTSRHTVAKTRSSIERETTRLMSIMRASIATISDLEAAAKMRLSKFVPPLACECPSYMLALVNPPRVGVRE